MALASGDMANFGTLQRASSHGDLALLECQDKATGEYRAVVVVVQRGTDGSVEFLPVAKMFSGNPYEEILPPE